MIKIIKKLHLFGFHKRMCLFLINHIFVGIKPFSNKVKCALLRSMGNTVGSKTTIVSPVYIIVGGIIGYIVLLVVTRYIFNRVVTSELFLIIGWTMLETAVINQLNADGTLGETGYEIMCGVIAAAFIISMVLYVAYYRMEEMKAFYAAMIPLVTEGAAMAVLVCMVRM